MPKLKSEQLALVAKAGELLQKLGERELESDSDEYRCFCGLSFFFLMRSPDEWSESFDDVTFRYILNALAWMEQIVKFSQILKI